MPLDDSASSKEKKEEHISTFNWIAICIIEQGLLWSGVYGSWIYNYNIRDGMA